MTVKYSSQRPLDELDGLQDFEDDFKEESAEPVLIVGVVQTQKIEHIIADGTDRPTVKFRQIEVVPAADAATVSALIKKIYQDRTGDSALELAGLEIDGDDE
ncbi:hypothetical protein [Lysinibacter cavernae]|uniref:Uncharacterized protein n=1 Tax=Lysinibacter cavernae TaxID=1640652 RepID=A0A7X5QYV4_9MICO|nr:hypothetical protein [Lysinibacter cavernae]NIH52518.1 hypothetical protein [Lysinibacter cavernae]